MEKRVTVGRIEVSPKASQLLSEELSEALTRHVHGDWGDMGRPQCMLNESALQRGDGQVLSRFKRANGDELWVNTLFREGVTRIELYSEILATIPEL